MSTELADILIEIVGRRKERLAEKEPIKKPAEIAATRFRPTFGREHAFLSALGGRQPNAVIAEIKLGSPRIGDLRGHFDPEERARLYRDNGAAALSVVVEPDFFHGSYGLLERCREASGLAAIAKDFIVDCRQIYWAREAGADAILLIAALYGAAELAAYADLARELGLVPLVETHDAVDGSKLAGRDWELVGVNNRDLRTFEVDLEQSIDRVAGLPSGALKVAESGLDRRADLERLSAAGFDAFLVGESLLLADDPAAKLRQLVG